MSELPLFDLTSQPTAGITRLYEHLELFHEGDARRNTLFVLGRPSLAERDPLQTAPDQLLIIDPPPDVTARFRIDGNAAVLYTGVQHTGEVGLPLVQTQAGGVAHIRIGNHYLDIYSQTSSNVVYLPALGILCGGIFGSDSVVPTVAEGSTGNEELETLRLLAQLVKQRTLQLYIPHIGSLCEDPVMAMQRLAADVAYLHKIRSAVQAVVERGESAEVIETIAPELLPESRQSASSLAVHSENLERLYRSHLRGQSG
ncbi:MAG: hypothetical protein KDE47_04720 [Caldilineaceae bacterium]|nr:hypothetical protein [Caldilineaceae bacterium]MCB0080205.1 hypothetical protein [Caldilineaceae bacterium]